MALAEIESYFGLIWSMGKKESLWGEKFLQLKIQNLLLKLFDLLIKNPAVLIIVIPRSQEKI